MSTFTEHVQQKSTYQIYSPGSLTCSTGSCNSETMVAKCDGCDWNYQMQTCATGCPTQPLCSKLNPNTCPNLGQGVTLNYTTDHDNICLKDNNQYPLVNCNYDASTFTYNDMVKYQDLFGINNDNYNMIIAPTFCYQSTTNCPRIPGQNKNWDNCPNIISPPFSNTPGFICKKWSSNNLDLNDTTMSTFCSNNNDNICDCVNRTDDPVYRYISSNFSSNQQGVGGNSPACWYKSCANPQSYLVPSDIHAACDSSVCIIINDIIATVPTNLSKSQLQESLNCKILNTPTPLANTEMSNISNPPITDSGTSFFFVWLIAAILVIIIILIIVFFIISSNKVS